MWLNGRVRDYDKSAITGLQVRALPRSSFFFPFPFLVEKRCGSVSMYSYLLLGEGWRAKTVLIRNKFRLEISFSIFVEYDTIIPSTCKLLRPIYVFYSELRSKGIQVFEVEELGALYLMCWASGIFNVQCRFFVSPFGTCYSLTWDLHSTCPSESRTNTPCSGSQRA